MKNDVDYPEKLAHTWSRLIRFISLRSRPPAPAAACNHAQCVEMDHNSPTTAGSQATLRKGLQPAQVQGSHGHRSQVRSLATRSEQPPRQWCAGRNRDIVDDVLSTHFIVTVRVTSVDSYYVTLDDLEGVNLVWAVHGVEASHAWPDEVLIKPRLSERV